MKKTPLEVQICVVLEVCTSQLWNSLNNLENKVLGCWCEPSQPCHADVLIKLFNEKKNDEIQQEFGIKTDKYENYETSVDLTDDE